MKPEAHHLRVVKRARYYTLGEREGVQDVWLVCHGYGQLAGQFSSGFATIAAPGRLIVAPEALHRFYKDQPPTPAAQRRVGATWMTREDREHDIADYVDYLDALVTEVLARNPQARLRALGFSQGSATVLRWAVHASRLPQQIILWAGEVPTDVDWRMGAKKLAHSQIIAVRGDQDELTSPAGFQKNLRILADAGLDVQQIEFSGGHHLDDALLVRLAQGRADSNHLERRQYAGDPHFFHVAAGGVRAAGSSDTSGIECRGYHYAGGGAETHRLPGE